MTTRTKSNKPKSAPLPSYKLLMPDGMGGTALAAHVEQGAVICRDDALVNRFRLMDYCVCNGLPLGIACEIETVQRLEAA